MAQSMRAHLPHNGECSKAAMHIGDDHAARCECTQCCTRRQGMCKREVGSWCASLTCTSTKLWRVVRPVYSVAYVFVSCSTPPIATRSLRSIVALACGCRPPRRQSVCVAVSCLKELELVFGHWCLSAASCPVFVKMQWWCMVLQWMVQKQLPCTAHTECLLFVGCGARGRHKGSPCELRWVG